MDNHVYNANVHTHSHIHTHPLVGAHTHARTHTNAQTYTLYAHTPTNDTHVKTIKKQIYILI